MNYRLSDSFFLQRCAQIAALGTGIVLDNPRVGAVLVLESQIIGEGYHQKAGEAHAEVNCLASVRAECRNRIPEATLYISLEPCCITGRTGACTDVIRRHGIKTVVFAQRDTTPGVDGESVEILRKAGITVREYPDFEPTKVVNAHRRVLTLAGRPRIILKYAQSADGFLRPADRSAGYWITSPVSRRLVHRWRADTSAIIVGGKTVVEDDPALTTRLFPGPDPVPVVIDPRSRLTGKEQLFTAGRQRPLVFSGAPRKDLPADVVTISRKLDEGALTQVLGELVKRRLGQVTVEGGAGILGAFLSAGLWDEARIFTGEVAFGAGLPAPQLGPDALRVSHQYITGDRLEIFRNTAVED